LKLIISLTYFYKGLKCKFFGSEICISSATPLFEISERTFGYKEFEGDILTRITALRNASGRLDEKKVDINGLKAYKKIPQT
jgi:hypothetical protein